MSPLLSAIPVVHRDLADLNARTDQEFNHLAEVLSTLSASARQIIADSTEAASLLAADSSAQGLGPLRAIPSGSHDDATGRDTTRQALNQMLQEVSACRAVIAKLPKVVLILKVLALHMRTEASQLREGVTELLPVAEEVATLAVEIEERSSHILDNTAKLAETIRGNLGRLLALNALQQRELAELVAKGNAGIELLARAAADSSAFAHTIATYYRSADTSVWEVVRSIQFQDIVRQQIEHVQQGLDEIRELTQAGLGRFRLYSPPRLAEASRIGVVQLAQLDNSRQTLASAVTNITGQLHAVSSTLQELSTHARKDTDVTPLLAGARENLAGLAQVLESHRQSTSQMEVITRAVATEINTTAESARQVEGLSFRLRLVSLNAQLKAAHLEQDGATLGTVAEHIQQVSDTVTQQTTELATRFQNLVDGAATIALHSSTDADNTWRMLPALAQGLRDSLHQLEARDRTFRTRMAAISERSAGVQRTLNELTTSLQSGDLAEQHIGRALQQLTGPLTAMHARYGQLGAPSEHLDAHASRYTVATERQIHASLTQASSTKEGLDPSSLAIVAAPVVATTAGLAALATATNDDPEDLGDNIELF